jgi:hypothetical protein
MNRLPAIASVVIGLPLIGCVTLALLLFTGMGTEESRYSLARLAVGFFAVQAVAAGLLLRKQKNLFAVLVVWGPVVITVAAIDLASFTARLLR